MGPDVHLHQYPFLTVDEWSGACASFVTACSGLIGEGSGWSSLSHHHNAGVDSIRIARQVLARPSARSADGEKHDAYTITEDCGGAINEGSDNEELIIRNGRQPYGRSEENLKDLFVGFEILLSPSYRVPVLYFTVKTSSGLPVTDYDTISSEVVPENFRSQVADVGVIGGVSMTDHPVTGLPSFFVHPCNTADALRQVGSSRNVLVSEYLFLWMGIIGPAVGLSVSALSLASSEVATVSISDE